MVEFVYQEVTIEGLSPLLMHRFSKKLYDESGKGKRQIPRYEDYAREVAYFTSDGSSLMIPADNLQGCLIGASSSFKIKGKGRQTLRPLICGSVAIEPKEIPLGTTEYEIDVRSVVLNRKDRILRARPKIWPWKATFVVVYAREDFPVDFTETLEELINDAGRRFGIMDFRPNKGGSFGRFRVVNIKEVTEKHVAKIRAAVTG